MQIDGKKTTLNDNAEIYKKSEERSESRSVRETWNSLDRKGRWEFFKSYYLGRILLFLLIAFVVGALVFNVVKPKKKELSNVVILDQLLDNSKVTTFFRNTVEELGYSTKKATVIYDDSLTSSTRNVNDMQALTSFLFAGTMDMLMANDEAIDRYAHQLALCDLNKYLPEDILAAIPEENRYIYHFVPDKNSPEGEAERDIFVGIYMDSYDFVKDAKYTTGNTDYILSLIVTGERVKSGVAIGVLRSILGLPQPADTAGNALAQ